MDDLLLMKGLTQEEQLMMMNEMSRRQKKPTTAVLFCLFLGGGGGHHFYMGKPALGVLYLLFFWTFIPALVALPSLGVGEMTLRFYGALNYSQNRTRDLRFALNGA